MEQAELNKRCEELMLVFSKTNRMVAKKCLNGFLRYNSLDGIAYVEDYNPEIEEDGVKKSGCTIVLKRMSNMLDYMGFDCQLNSSDGTSTWRAGFSTSNSHCVLSHIHIVDFKTRTISHNIAINFSINSESEHLNHGYRFMGGNVYNLFEGVGSILEKVEQLSPLVGQNTAFEIMEKAYFKPEYVEHILIAMSEKNQIKLSQIEQFLSRKNKQELAGRIALDKLGL